MSGRALFREVVRRWGAGEIQCSPVLEDDYISYERLLHHQKIAETVVQQRGAIEEACLLQKVYGREGKVDIFLTSTARLEFLVYLCNLAEVLGYGTVLDSLERVWKRAVTCSRVGGTYVLIRKDAMAQLNTMIMEARGLLPGAPEFDSAFHAIRKNIASRLITRGMHASALQMLGKEILSALWLVSFLLDASLYFSEFGQGSNLFYRKLLLDIFQTV